MEQGSSIVLSTHPHEGRQGPCSPCSKLGLGQKPVCGWGWVREGARYTDE